MSSSPRILVVDDEPYITDLLGAALRFEGFEVEVADTGRAALAALRSSSSYDLVLLDLVLPDLNGIDVCRQLRREGNGVSVVLLTARDATEEKVEGFEAGADDYLTKPFSLDELVARMRAVLRRAGTSSIESGRLSFADLVMDEETHEVWRAGDLVELTATEFRLLHYLLANARRVISKAELLEHVWDYDFEGDPNIVETYISYLRKKIDHVDPPLIHTIRGVGYSVRLPPGSGT
jgi:two-component system OmpR family response regulator